MTPHDRVAVSRTWGCADAHGYLIPNVNFTFQMVYFYSNAHYHGPLSTEPVSTTTPTSGFSSSGYFTVTLATKLVGQEEYQSATCSNPVGSASGNVDFAVGYGDVDYADVPSGTTNDEEGGRTSMNNQPANLLPAEPALVARPCRALQMLGRTDQQFRTMHGHPGWTWTLQ